MSQAKTESSSAEPFHQAESPLLKGPDLERRFHELVSEWRAEVAPLSSATARVQHPAYRAIIALGPPMVPLLFREIEQRPNHWFAALRSLTRGRSRPRRRSRPDRRDDIAVTYPSWPKPGAP